MTSVIDIKEIQELIPHRFPFLLVDKVLSYEIGETLVAIKNVTVNEPFFSGHFPGQPVMPGVLMIEALAQAGAILAFKTLKETDPDNKTNILYLAGVNSARFKRIVEPGDQLMLKVQIIKNKGPIWKLQSEATVDGELACTAELMAALAE